MASTAAKRKSSIDSDCGRLSVSLSSGGTNSFQLCLADFEEPPSGSASVESKPSQQAILNSLEISGPSKVGRILPIKRKLSHDSTSLIDDHALGLVSDGLEHITKGHLHQETDSVAAGSGTSAASIQFRNALEHLDALGDERVVGVAKKSDFDDPATDIPTDVPAIPFAGVVATDVPAPDVLATDVPGTNVPATDNPVIDVPVTDVPVTNAPNTGVPNTVPATVPLAEVPASDAPVADVPTTDGPSTDVPATDVPTMDVPTMDAPTTNVPATDVPTTDVPTTDAPTTDAPTTDAPTTDAPTTDVPTTDVPTADVATADVPATDTLGADLPATDVPATNVSVTDVPATDILVADVPVNDVPMTNVPANDVPATDIPETNARETDARMTDVTNTGVPSTILPCTSNAPATDVLDVPAPNIVPAEIVPATNVPKTNDPARNALATNVSATDAPTTNIPSSNVPPTNVPPTNVPPTNVPATNSPATPTTNTPATDIPASTPATGDAIAAVDATIVAADNLKPAATLDDVAVKHESEDGNLLYADGYDDDDGTAAAAAAAVAALAENGSGSEDTLNSSGQRLLLEAIMLSDSMENKGRNRLESWGGMSDLSVQNKGRIRLESWGGMSDSSAHKKGRNRLESWGGMSDLSVPLFNSENASVAAVDAAIGLADVADAAVAAADETAAALAASSFHHASIFDDVAAAANLGPVPCGNSLDMDISPKAKAEPVKSESVPSKISLRKGSIASLSEASGFPLSVDGELSNDIQAVVAAAMASVGDQLAELAGAVELAASNAETFSLDAIKREIGDGSDASTLATPNLDFNSDMASKYSGSDRISTKGGESKSSKGVKDLGGEVKDVGVDKLLAPATSTISVDYDAVAAAVDAAEAATGALDLAAIGQIPVCVKDSIGNRRQHRQNEKNRADNLLTRPTPDAPVLSTPMRKAHPVPKSKMTEKELEVIRERARAAAGYVPPTPGSADYCLPPPKKRARRTSPDAETHQVNPTIADTPKVKNTTARTPASVLFTPQTPSSAATPSSKGAAKGQSSQKWDSMFDCLLQFIDDRRKEETHGASEQEKKLWTWDGNVPTTYKTDDGKALGRWINNQRSAKSKGTLKLDREQRLVDAGLKWSVLASNSWNEMLEELRDYVREQTKEGRRWDGNVPTNYRIKAKATGRFVDEDKNLGRWVNRQRSLYQAGKLRKDRQVALEKVGLKWSMLATTSWESMYDTLCEYVDEKKKEGRDWDGNVPANYRTSDNPPRALGRWINRQRSSYVKNKLKAEYVEKLNGIGLKWSVHERKLTSGVGGSQLGCDSEDDDNYEIHGDGVAKESLALQEKKTEMKKVEERKVELKKVEVTKVQVKRAEAPRIQAPNVQAPKVQAAKVQATKVQAMKVQSTNVQATKVKATNVQATNVQATNVPATNVQATNVQATNVQATKVQATNVQATNVQATNVQATNVQATNIQATNVQATRVQATKFQVKIEESKKVEEKIVGNKIEEKNVKIKIEENVEEKNAVEKNAEANKVEATKEASKVEASKVETNKVETSNVETNKIKIKQERAEEKKVEETAMHSEI